jgi:hypothetical protein
MRTFRSSRFRRFWTGPEGVGGAEGEPLQAGRETRHGIVYTYDDTLPRNKAAFSLWVSTLEEFLTGRPDEEAVLNRVHHLVG